MSSYSDRQLKRMSEERSVVIEEVNMTTKIVTMIDQFNTKLYASLDFAGPIMYIPQVGENWIAQRKGVNNWRLINRHTQTTDFEGLSPGDYKFDPLLDPQQIEPSTINTQILTTVNGITQWATAPLTQAYVTVQDEGTSLPQESIIDFIGSGVTAADDPTNHRTTVTIPGSNSGNYILLKTITLNSNSQIDWGSGSSNGSIPQTYRDLIIVIRGKINAAVLTATLYIMLNDDSGSSYANNLILLNNGSPSYSGASYPTVPVGIGELPGTSVDSHRLGIIEATIYGYSDATISDKCIIFQTTLNYSGGLNQGNHNMWGSVNWYDAIGNGVTRITMDATGFPGNGVLSGTRVDFYGRGIA